MTSPAGSFMTSFADSFLAQKSRKEASARADADRALMLEDRAAYRRQVTEDREWQRSSGADGSRGSHGGSPGTDGGSSQAWSGGAEPFRTTDPLNTKMPAYQRAFLNAIAGGESAGKYNIRYTPKGGATFDLADGHPRVFEPGPHGKSSAAGRYQFTWTTWKGLAGADTPFTPENQDAFAWKLATRDYHARTGRDLDADLQKGGLTDEMMSALTPTWQAFKGNRGRHSATYRDSLERLSGSAPPAASSAVQRREVVDPEVAAAPAASPAPSLSFGLPPASSNALARRTLLSFPS